MRVQELASVVEKDSLAGGLHHLVLRSPRIASAARAGTFVMLSVRPGKTVPLEPLLPRPFSLMSTLADAGLVEIYFRVVGRGTALLSALEVGDVLNMIGPLGRPWPHPPGDAIIVAGGAGMPPALFLAEELGRAAGEAKRPSTTSGHAASGSREVIVFYGASTRSQLFFLDRFSAAGAKVHVSTDDGSAFRRGTCLELLETWLDDTRPSQATVYGCGPPVMLSRLFSLVSRFGLPSYVSLESPMACGVGVCRGCAVKMRDGSFRMACTDGPVFKGEEVAF